MTSQPARHWSRAIAFVATAVVAVGLAGCTAPKDEDAGFLTIPREGAATFTENFNPLSPSAAPLTNQAIYEPLLIVNPVEGDLVPWLATDWDASGNGTSLSFTVRENVNWSDGEPFEAEDVVFTFDLVKDLLGAYDYVEDVVADGQTVTFTFNRPYSPGLYEVGQQVMLPEHIWASIDDPANEMNKKPVGTGPYTEVVKFESQSFDLGPNPHYWQPEKQKIPGVRMLAFADNNGAVLAASSGQVDWSDQFFPDIESVFVAKDPEHRAYWNPPAGGIDQWILNTTKAPFNDPIVRKAMSAAIDRDLVSEIAMYGYTHGADCTGLADAVESWKDSAVVDSCTWTTLDLEGANELLDDAGYERDGSGNRVLLDGSPFAFEITVGAGTTNWIAAAEHISTQLKELGITATVKTPDWGQVVDGWSTGNFDSGVGWSSNGPTPYNYYRGTLSSNTSKPVGEPAGENYGRFSSPEADALLAAFESTFDEAEQRDIASQLQEIYAAEAPYIPLFPEPQWGAYSDKRFVGWPSEDNPYATLSARTATAVLVLTSLEPVK